MRKKPYKFCGRSFSSNNLKHIRQTIGLTQEEMGNMLLISKSLYNRYEVGAVPIKSCTLKHMAIMFNCSIDYILNFRKYRSQKIKTKHPLELTPLEKYIQYVTEKEQNHVASCYASSDNASSSRPSA